VASHGNNTPDTNVMPFDVFHRKVVCHPRTNVYYYNT